MKDNLLEDFRNNKPSSLHTVKCYPWNVNGNVLLIGDSAHAIVPFYAQGLNCTLEDCYVFDQIFEKYEGNWN
jgi:kynurenine 3-monooxygenase